MTANEDAKENQPTKIIDCDAVCAQCGKKVKRRLDLVLTSKVLCSFECERAFWLDIFW